MKVVVTVEADAETWAQKEGCAPEDALNDLRSYVLSSLLGSYAIEESGAKVTVVEVPPEGPPAETPTERVLTERRESTEE